MNLTSPQVQRFWREAEAALAWCRQHGATLVYSPIDLFKN